MPAPADHVEKFQTLLRELFQFDRRDLDFGVYRIMNHKRGAVERFVSEKLPDAVSRELETGALGDSKRANDALEEAKAAVLKGLRPDAIDADCNLADDLRGFTLGKEYLAAQQAAAAVSVGLQSAETAIYNHLYAFFRRYYQDGDFISKHRYSRAARYAIPYNGEEVYLHWANSDQYYVKTAELFRNYDWNAPNGVAVRFRIRDADVENGNVKGEKRLFVPIAGGAEWDGGERAITVPFEYRPLTDAEKRRWGAKNQQDKIIAAATESIPAALIAADAPADALSALNAEYHPAPNGGNGGNRNANGETRTQLERHLKRYARGNQSDFFIHKDLAGFLSRELDFYIKNEILNLDDLTAGGERAGAGWFQIMRAVKSIGAEIIDFLAQIEEFQKTLWEKRKFVTDVQYCVTLGAMGGGFLDAAIGEIIANEAQWAEWRDMLGIDAADRSAVFLKANPTLAIDTAHFNPDFNDRLLASFPDLDAATDGVLIHGENWQALRLMEEKYRGAVKCAHIDPPYNTQTSGFFYKNGYKHSSWLSMIHDRIVAGNVLLADDGFTLCHIDENEYEKFHVLLGRAGIPVVGTVVWDKRNPMTGGGGIATQHEYIIYMSHSGKAIRLRDTGNNSILDKASELIRKHGSVSDATRSEFSRWVSGNDSLTGGEKAYRYIDAAGGVYRAVSLRAPEYRTDPKFHKPLAHPATGKPCPVPPNGFSRTPDTLKAMMERGEILFGVDESTQPQQKRLLERGARRQLSSVIQNATRGKADLDALGLENFPYCHSASFYEDLVGAVADAPNEIVLDYFAGSGTTAHAVINLNREDGGRRRFVLVEMGEYFDTVLLPRVKKIIFSPEWRAGSPKRAASPEEAERGPRIVKRIRIESYEDALDGIEFDQPTAGQMPLEDRLGDEYVLKYMLKWETRASRTLLNISKLTRPFDYSLRCHANGEKRERTADLAETFNWLIGMSARTRRVYRDGDRRYLVYDGETRAAPGRRTVIIWRDTDVWEERDYERDRDFVAEQEIADGADVVYSNGSGAIPNSRDLEPLFAERMFAGGSA